MSVILSKREAAILQAFVGWAAPADPDYRDENREALFCSDELYEILHNLYLPTFDVLLSTYEYIESLCDNTSGYAKILSEFSSDVSYVFSASFVLHYIAEDPKPKNWLGGLEAELSLFLEDFEGNADGKIGDELASILKPIGNEAVARDIISKFFELAESGPKNIKGQSFSEVLDEAGLLPKF